MNETLENLNMLKIEISIGKFWKPFNNISLHNPTEAEKKNKKKTFSKTFSMLTKDQLLITNIHRNI